MNLYSRISDKMFKINDDVNTDYLSAKLIKDYNNSAEAKQRIIDDVFITLTGFSLQSLIDAVTVKN